MFAGATLPPRPQPSTRAVRPDAHSAARAALPPIPRWPAAPSDVFRSHAGITSISAIQPLSGFPGGLIMCDIIGEAIDSAITRRRLLSGAAAVGAGVLASIFGTPASATEIAQQQERVAQANLQQARLTRASCCSARRAARHGGRIRTGEASHRLSSWVMRYIWWIAAMAQESGYSRPSISLAPR